MELGRIAEIDNAKLNNVEKVQKVNETSENDRVIQDDEYKKVLGNREIIDKNEVILDNVMFGYNKSSKDFFVKVTKGEAEYKYPTEDMMKVKAYLLQELESQK
ncbi:flagellin [Poseidonibacter lekithochrous]|uniref:flagellin n=1 Tax=Poseidonibacter lekithochrous TaxID=1904463 RepID=UPI0008FC7337|nr:flagellin [Poseidonibacter lekithochrous]QKJ24073.1 FlaG family protein [Poseidonibacter lekithochrous]